MSGNDIREVPQGARVGCRVEAQVCVLERVVHVATTCGSGNGAGGQDDRIMRVASAEIIIRDDKVTVDETPKEARRRHRRNRGTGMPELGAPLPQRLGSIEACSGGSAYILELVEENSGAVTTLMVRPVSEDGVGALSAVHQARATSPNDFEKRTDRSSSQLYFHYYGMLQHQQNMLQDHIRTGTYFAALTENRKDFQGKAVMDVGCGSGILSFFAAQAGARVVYAVEASEFAHYAERLVNANPVLGSKIRVIKGKVEEVTLPEKVDVLVSEPMGTLLVNERMLETYLYARDHHMKPGGKMYPSNGTIYLTAFSDEMLYNEISNRSAFWQHSSFYGIDLGALAEEARQSCFAQPVVDQIPPQVLVSNSAVQTFDFETLEAEELLDFEIPLSFQVGRGPCVVHGIACWFDVGFSGSTLHRILSTSPGVPLTHWYQLRCMLMEPIRVRTPGQTIKGSMRLTAHSRQSYDVSLVLQGPNGEHSHGAYDLKEPYYRQLYDPAVGTGDSHFAV